MRISDWSSDVCSSDLIVVAASTRTICQPKSDWTGSVTLPGCAEKAAAATWGAVADANSPRFCSPIAMSLAEKPFRSEEHTSELKSLMRSSYAVFCLIKQQHKIVHQI